MGIVNVTPDSFSDGGKFFDSAAAVEQGLRLVGEGADILDIGGESTRPYSDPVAEEEEFRRVEPVLAALIPRAGVPVSIDTTKPRVAALGVAAGVEILNDIAGFTDERMLDLAVQSGCGLCAMHIRGTPQDMQDNPTYHDVVAEVLEYLAVRRDAMLAAGADPDRICLDPGIGFGKTHEHNRQLVAHCDRFLELGQPLLVGHSRKGFIAKLARHGTPDRLGGTIGVAIRLAELGVDVIRVHDVAAVREALDLYFATANPR